MVGANALAYYEKALLTAVKSFITLATGINYIKLFRRNLRLYQYMSLGFDFGYSDSSEITS